MTGFEEKVLEKLDNIQALYGYTGLWVPILALIVGLLIWFFLKTYFENNAESFFKKSLADYQKELVQEVGQKFIDQKGAIDEKIANLSGDIQKDVRRLQSNLQLITNQKNNFLNQKKEAIVEFYSNYINWLRTIENIDPLSLHLHKNIPLMADDYLRIMQEASTKCQISEGKLDLYNRNDDINALKNESVKLIKFLQETKSLAIVDIRDLWYKINHEGYIHKENEVDEIVNKYQEDRELVKDPLYKITNDLRAKLSELLSEISD